MSKVINISSNGIKQAIDDLVNENELLQDKVYKLEEQLQQKENIIKEVREKLLCYGETFDLKLHQQMQKELLEILDKEVN